MNETVESQVRAYVVDHFLFGQGGDKLKSEDSFLEKGLIDSTGVLEVDGWLAVSASEGVLPDAALVVLEDGNGTRRLFETRRTRHPWVGNKFGKPGMAMAGFTTVVDVSGMTGDYTLGLALLTGDRIRVCPQLKLPGSIDGTGR